MPILELCAGYGGLGMAVEALTGDKVAFVAENDEAASLVLATRFPDAPNIGDMTVYDWSQLDGLVDIVAAGFSCQDISSAGPRKGIDGKRSRIWKDVCKAVRVIRPRLVFLENVAAIRSRGLDVVAQDLAAVGYDLWWVCVRASQLGAAHPRDRWFAIARPAEDAHGAAGPERRGTAPGQTEGGWPRPNAGRRSEFSPAEWWGDYLPAVRRWERLIQVPAPAPTELGPRGGRRLTASFAEWLMGIPGHVTGVPGLSRAQQLARIGNGAMPQQAYAAYGYLLDLIKKEAS